MAGRKITVEFLGDSKDLQRAMDDAEGKSGRLGGTLKKVGKMAAVGLGAGLLVGGAALVKMTQGAMEDEAAQKRLEGVLKNTTGATDKQVAAVEDWITAQGKALGVADDDLRPALEKLAASTGSVEEAQRQASIAMDVAAGRGVSLEQVTKAMERANNGNVAGLSRLGIETKNAAGETISMEEAQRRLADTYGGAAATKADTLQGKMDRLKLILSETGETIGSKLIPMVTNVADWFLNKGVPAVSAFGDYLRDKLGPIFDTIKGVVSNVMSGMQGDVGGKLGAIQGIFSDFASIAQSLWDTFGATILDFVTNAFENVKTVIGGALTVISGIFQTFSALLQGDWAGAWDGIKQIVSGAFEVIKGLVRQQMNIISTVMELAWTAISGLVSGAWDGIKTVVSNGIGKVVGWVQDIPGKFTSALSTLKATVEGLFKDAMAAGETKVQNIGADIVAWVAGIPGKLAGKLADFKKAGSDLIGGFVEGMKNAGGVIEGIAGNVWDAVKGLLNGAIDKINAALEFTIDLPGPKNLTVDVANIPHLAKGTNFHKGGMALVGEEGPELVNLPRGSRVTPNGESMGAMRGLGDGSGGVTIIINGALDPSAVAQQIETLLIRRNREVGPLSFVTRAG